MSISPTSNQASTSATSETHSESFISDTYEDVVIVKQLNQGKFPIFLVFLPGTKKYLALKAFDFQKNKPHTFFKNEIRFAGLNHTNIINILYADEQTRFLPLNNNQTVSCILMEHAPYGNLSQFMQKLEHNFTDKLARTYFRQLIQALDYLHDNGVCHFDIKPENLLIGDDYQLKIADFDLSYVKGDPNILTKGSKYYRAPELINDRGHVDKSADVYSAGIILFVMKCRGLVPHTEDKCYRGINFLELLNTDPEEFFDSHQVLQGRESSFFDGDFRELFISMTRPEAVRRATIEDIKKSKWYNGPVYTAKELRIKFKSFLSCVSF